MDKRIFIGRNKFFARAAAGTRTREAKIALIICALSFCLSPISFALDSTLQQAANNISNAKLTICLPAIDKLGFSKSPAAVAPLAQAFAREQRALVRRYLVDALGHLGLAEGRPTLIAALQDPDTQVRESAIAALSVVGGKESEAALRDRVGAETDSDVKAHLIYHLGQTHSTEDFNKLQSLKNDADPRVSQMANQELKKHIQNGTN